MDIITNLIQEKDQFLHYLWQHKQSNVSMTTYTQLFLNELGQCQQEWKIIHVSGTNGKGSTCLFLSYLLTHLGFRVGLYTSPHLINVNERICFQHQPILDSKLIALANDFVKLDQNIPIQPTPFTILTGIALLYFKEQCCDFVILETGLGGLMDSTNFPCNKTCIIQTIDYDHTAILGSSLYEITKQKLGIIHHRNPILVGKQLSQVKKWIQQSAKQQQSTLFEYGKDFNSSHLQTNRHGLQFDWQSKTTLKQIRLPMLQKEQIDNLSLALKTLETYDIKISESWLNNCLANFELPGRFQIIQAQPYVILDVAHNPHSLHHVFKNMDNYFSHVANRILVIAMNPKKDHQNILPAIKRQFNQIIVTQLTPDIPNPKLIGDLQHQCLDKVQFIPSFNNVYTKLPLHDKNALILITGSFVLVGKAMVLFRSHSLTTPSSNELG